MDPEILVIVDALVAYVRVNPHACDTSDGIERWWLSDRSHRSEDVRVALDWMVQQGYLQTTTAADGRTRYRRIAADESLKAVLDYFRLRN
jgi:hypothetical protein